MQAQEVDETSDFGGEVPGGWIDGVDSVFREMPVLQKSQQAAVGDIPVDVTLWQQGNAVTRFHHIP